VLAKLTKKAEEGWLTIDERLKVRSRVNEVGIVSVSGTKGNAWPP